jgi:hypothetical protein
MKRFAVRRIKQTSPTNCMKKLKKNLSQSKKDQALAIDDLKCLRLEEDLGIETLRYTSSYHPGPDPDIKQFAEYVNKKKSEDLKKMSKTILRLSREPKNSPLWKLLKKNANMIVKSKYL